MLRKCAVRVLTRRVPGQNLANSSRRSVASNVTFRRSVASQITSRRSVVSSSSVGWRKGDEHVQQMSCNSLKSETNQNLASPTNSHRNQHDESKERRYLYPELLFGFSLLSVANILNKDEKEQPSENKTEEKTTENKNDARKRSKFSLLQRFQVNAAEKVSPPNVGQGGAGDGNKLSRRERYNFIADVVQETAPSLVYIEIKDTGNKNYFTGQPITHSNGSGFIVDSDGLILTNAHVVINKPRASIQVRLHNGETYVGAIEDIDVKSDLATVRIKCNNLHVMKLGQSKDVKPGEFVVAMGSPLSLSNTITTGVVSNVARPPREMGLEGRDVPEYIQTDAAITFGNSGGPLINLDGEAIGINSLKVTPGISFAIPIDYAKEFLNKSAEASKAGWPTGKRRYIGITMLSLSPQIIEELRYRGNIHPSVSAGILIYRLVDGSPAHKAGLQSGDIITHINDHPVYGSRDVYKILEGKESPLNLTICRAKENNIHVKVYPENR